LPIAPHLERFALRLPAGSPARVVLASTINLLPGTLCAELHADHLTIHALTASSDIQANLTELEEVVAALFGLRLEPPPHP
jgi:multicomponent Na+:H+ antiporter subunit E